MDHFSFYHYTPSSLRLAISCQQCNLNFRLHKGSLQVGISLVGLLNDEYGLGEEVSEVYVDTCLDAHVPTHK